MFACPGWANCLHGIELMNISFKCDKLHTI